jgi:dTDP-4-dehydrorhamnose 3,5-epimerase
MEFQELSIAGLYRLDARWIGDQRGGFARLFCQEEFEPYIAQGSIRQINYSINRERGTVRGLHYQNPPHAEVKIVRCVAGKIFDVVVDLRRGSATFLHWLGIELSAANKQALLIPQGCAHGFQTLEDDSELLYFHSEFYTPSAEAGIRHDDPRLGIEWPLMPINLSDRDTRHPLIAEGYDGIALQNL